jgi:predicted ATPase
MISELRIVGFKRFADETLTLAPLTVLSGLNGAGKTSVIQALLLARRAARKPTMSVPLNGPYGLELGSIQDVFNVNAPGNEIVFSFREGGSTVRFVFDSSDESLLHLPIKERPQQPPSPFGSSDRAFTYLCAERFGPRSVLGASANPLDELSVGSRGEFCAQILASHDVKEKVPPTRRHPARQDEVSAFLKYQVEAWLTDIIRPVELEATWYPGTTVTALRFRTPGADWVKAPNMGFGVSYSLPIVLAGLFGTAGGMLIIENPEAHLHPAGQSRMGVFLSLMAAAGTQVIIETHSDHILNGIRRAIGEHMYLSSEAAMVQFLDLEPDGNIKAHALRINSAGALSDWPTRFFDQYQLDVAALSRVRRGRSA